MDRVEKEPRTRERWADLAARFLDSYESGYGINRIGEEHLPAPADVVAILEELLALMYPGYHGRPIEAGADLHELVAGRLSRVEENLAGMIERTLRFCARGEGSCRATWTGAGFDGDPQSISDVSRRLVHCYLDELPAVREMLALDVRAAYEGDPAATSNEEIILCYPGVYAISVHRLSHPLFCLGVPLLPRIMSEWAHHRTGVDIHPGARIGERFFIDHATGVVIGETTRIGERVKIYQGVTLGALSFPRNPDGTLVKGGDRHPTIGDRVTIYANATILGGDTVVGDGAVIGGGAWITESVPPGARVVPAMP